MTISRDEVEHVAHLARLELTDEEVERFRQQLAAVLEHARRIQSIELDDVAPTARPLEYPNVMRADEVVVFEGAEDILRNAPSRDENFFSVPQILEDEA